MEHCGLAVIGGGPAGMAAALEAQRAGVASIVILERERELGGILQQCIHTGFGLKYFQQDLTGPEYAERFIRQVRESGIFWKTDTTVLGMNRNKRLRVVSPTEGFRELQAEAVVIATGCRERTREALGISGSRPAGVWTAGTAQRFMNIEGFRVGERIVILGSGDIGLIMARRLMLEGSQVLAVAEIRSKSPGLRRNQIQCLEDFGIPLLLNHTVTSIIGRDRVNAVILSQVDQDLLPVPGTEKKLACDTLLISAGLIPENELAVQAGLDMDPGTNGLIVNSSLSTSADGIFACGNALYVHDLADSVTLEGERAGQAAARYILSLANKEGA